MIRLKIYLYSIALVVSVVASAQTNWNISDDYSITFSGSGASGTFEGLDGDIQFDPEDLANARFNVSINPTTISTGNQTKDKHARGKSWFNVEKFSKVKFVSSRVIRTSEGYSAEGALLLHGISKKIRIDFTFSEEDLNTGLFEGKLTVDRQDFGIEGPFVSFMVGNEFEVSLRVPVTR